MPKTVVIGAGSKFTPRLATDILSYPALQEGEIALVDIAPGPLPPTRT